MTPNVLTRSLFALLSLVLLAFTTSASAQTQAPPRPEARVAREDIQKTLGFVPGFFKVTADPALPGVWEEMKGLQLNPNSALPGKIKELIGLAVAAQVPCRYCVYAHTEFAKLNGAREGEVAEAVAIGGSARHWSALVSGAQIDQTKYRAEIARLVQGAKSSKQTTTPILVMDAKSALTDIEQHLGFVPEFLRTVPELALPGAWRELRDLKLSPKTELSPKDKALIALSVASQIPSPNCIFAETEFAKLSGA